MSDMKHSRDILNELRSTAEYLTRLANSFAFTGNTDLSDSLRDEAKCVQRNAEALHGHIIELEDAMFNQAHNHSANLLQLAGASHAKRGLQ